jgi:hypothetical protein
MHKGMFHAKSVLAGLGIALVAISARAQDGQLGKWETQATAIIPVAATGPSADRDASVALANLDYYSDFYGQAAPQGAAENHVEHADAAPAEEAAPASNGGNGSCVACGGCEGGCDVCCSTCAPCRNWFGSVEATFLFPDIDGGFADVLFEDFDAGTTSFIASDDAAGVDDLYAAPRVALGVMGCRWGVLARYWQLDGSESANEFLDPLSGDTDGVIAFERLNAYTVDIELIRRFCRCNRVVDVAFGARHATLEHDGSILGIAISENDELFSAGASISRQFDGTGLTGAIGSSRQFACRPCVSLFWNLRTSFLWGDASNTVITAAAQTDGVGFSQSNDFAFASADDDLFIGEFQVGVQWNHALRCAPVNAFFRTAFEYQYWDVGGSTFAESESFALVPGSAGISAAGEADNLTMDLVGFSVGTGFTW